MPRTESATSLATCVPPVRSWRFPWYTTTHTLVISTAPLRQAQGRLQEWRHEGEARLTPVDLLVRVYFNAEKEIPRLPWVAANDSARCPWVRFMRGEAGKGSTPPSLRATSPCQGEELLWRKTSSSPPKVGGVPEGGGSLSLVGSTLMQGTRCPYSERKQHQEFC
jgi:hypothetical protein